MIYVSHICVPIKLISEIGGRLKIAIKKTKKTSNKSEMFTKLHNSRDWDIERKAMLQGLQWNWKSLQVSADISIIYYIYSLVLNYRTPLFPEG